MSISDITAIINRSQAMQLGDQYRVGRYIGTVTGWQRQPAWVDYEWNIQLWVPQLARHIWKPAHELAVAS